MTRAVLAAGRVRALDTRPAFWLAMFMASAFGANLGDYTARAAFGRPASFAVMAVICIVAVVADRAAGLRTEAFYWVAIIALRAAATNAADAIVRDLHVDIRVAALVTGVLSLLVGLFTRPPGPAVGSPLVDGRYWVAMLLAGLFGTLAGDFTSRTVGLPASSLVLTALLLVVLGVRALAFPGVMLAYWVAVLAERSAATPVADYIDGPRGLALGLPVAMAITSGLFLAALLLRRQVDGRASTAPA